MQDEKAKKYWSCADMLRYCDGSSFASNVNDLFATDSPWIIDAIADPIARSGSMEHASRLNDALVDPRYGVVSSYVARALPRAWWRWGHVVT